MLAIMNAYLTLHPHNATDKKIYTSFTQFLALQSATGVINDEDEISWRVRIEGQNQSENLKAFSFLPKTP